MVLLMMMTTTIACSSVNHRQPERFLEIRLRSSTFYKSCKSILAERGCNCCSNKTLCALNCTLDSSKLVAFVVWYFSFLPWISPLPIPEKLKKKKKRRNTWLHAIKSKSVCLKKKAFLGQLFWVRREFKRESKEKV